MEKESAKTIREKVYNSDPYFSCIRFIVGPKALNNATSSRKRINISHLNTLIGLLLSIEHNEYDIISSWIWGAISEKLRCVRVYF